MENEILERTKKCSVVFVEKICKSCHIQNVTTFINRAVGQKVPYTYCKQQVR